LEDLLDISRITRGSLPLRKEWTPLRAVVDAAMETAGPLIEERGHEVTLDLPPQPLFLQADPLRLAQVLANLLTNAAKYTAAGGQITIAAWTQGEAVHIAVSDTGIGIARDALPGIFEMFSQTVSALERVEEGLGIGLALVKGLVELHGGRVEASSPGEGRGSRFEVQLPGGRPPKAEAVVDTGVAAASPKRAARVLIADDNHDMADSLGLFLRLLGHEVEVVYGGAEAVDAC